MRCRLFKPKDPQSFYSEPNIITLLRLVLSLTFFTLAVIKMSPTYNFIGLGIHYVGDVLDGTYARKFKQETILGAEIDIIADRVEFLFFFINFLHFHPELFLPVSLFIVNFAFVDFYLSYQFLKYDIISPNYYYKVDKRVYWLNYGFPAKTINSTLVAFVLIFLPQFHIIATICACIFIGIKIYSIDLLRKKSLADRSIN